MEVTETIFNQYQHIQRDGPVNMVNKTGVRRVAEEYGFEELVEFIDSGDYHDILMNYGEYDEEFNA